MESRENIDIDLQKFWGVIKRRWLPATTVFGCVVTASVMLASLQKGSYEAGGKILVQKTNQTSALTGLGEKIGQLEGLDIKSSPINTEMEILNSIPILEKTINALNLKDEKKGVPLKAEELAKKIKIKAIPSTDIIQLTYESKNPQEAAAVVNQLMRFYIENNLYNNKSTALAAGDFIAKQIPIVETRVRRAEIALRRFKERNQVVALEEESKSSVEILKELESKITETRVALADANTRSKDLEKKVGMESQEATDMDTLNRSTGVQKLLEEFQQVESQLAAERTRLMEEHPTVENLRNKREALKALLDQRIGESLGDNTQKVATKNLQTGEVKQQITLDLVKSEVEYSALASRLGELVQAKNLYKQRINIIPRLEQEQRELQRQLEAAQFTYETLLKRRQEVQIAENQNIGNARVLESALVTKKSPMTTVLILVVLGGLTGTLLGTATIVVLEARDKSIKRLKEAKEIFEYTLLGIIPSLSKKIISRRKDAEWTIPELPVRDTPRLPIAQAYQMLQANLKFLSSDKPVSVIAVSSSVSGEGKTTVSANLATAIAQLGRKVLLVDADMHHPLQHHVWNLANVAGLSDVIVGQAEFNTAVKQAMPNLDILTSGATPPNPLALLDSKRMAALIEHFSANYDFVIFDAPPIALGADALTLGKITDGILLVARPGVVNSSSATAAKDSLLRSGQNVLGLVVNGVMIENEPDSYFYYDKEYSDQQYARQTESQSTINSQPERP
jgi:capsular exopolysaccharide synthesis family protein